MSDKINQQNNEQEMPKAAINPAQADVLEQLLKPEVQESLTVLVDQLPKLTELATLLTKTYDFAQSIATDDILKHEAAQAFKEASAPIKNTAKSLAVNAMDAKERAEKSNEVIGLFGLMKMLKDPQVQKSLRFINAFLQVSNERSAQK